MLREPVIIGSYTSKIYSVGCIQFRSDYNLKKLTNNIK